MVADKKDYSSPELEMVVLSGTDMVRTSPGDTDEGRDPWNPEGLVGEE